MKQLLIKLRDYIIKEEGFTGMCGSAYEMHLHNLISFEEYDILYDYFSYNRKGRNFNCGPYWWNPGNKKPRLKWLDKQIKNYKDESISETDA